MENLISKLSYDKFKIKYWNENLVRMDLFKSFITIELTASTNHLGASNGWTEYYNKEHKLIIHGGWFKGVEWIDSIQYGKNLHNPYNNYCTALHLAPIMTKEGVEFFKEYYKPDITAQIIKAKDDISRFQDAVKSAKDKLEAYTLEVDSI